jgi:D-alanyl-D-alanine carboxypeptidase/D-alanyl-D-alanine-endopeptidase (penicillin-binding protein 4)
MMFTPTRASTTTAARTPSPLPRLPHRRDRSARRTWLGPVACALLSVVASAAALAQELNTDVQRLINKAHLGQAVVGVSIVDLQSNQTLAAINEDRALIPASNMKLFTSGAALLALGADYAFTTKIWATGDRLVIEGDGDPGLGDPELLKEMGKSPGDLVDWMAEQARRAGVAADIREIVVDDRVFDTELVHPSWPTDQLDKWYCAEVSGLNFHANVIQVFASPAQREGEAPTLRVEPATPAIMVVNKARTVRGEMTALAVDRQGDENRFLVSGSIRGALDEPAEATTHASGLVLARMLADRLAVNGQPKPVCRVATPGETLGDPDVTVAIVRTTMEKVLQRCNADSHNLYAECLLKRAGHAATGQAGSWANGAALLRMKLRELIGPEAAAGISVSDGSGMSRQNRVTAAIMTSWLGAMQKDRGAGHAFVESISIAGREGVVAKRFQGRKLDNEVRAKSGFINGVRSLSGYVTHTDTGRRVAFSVLINDVPGNMGAKAKDLHEDIVEVVDRWLSQREKSRPRPQVGG